MQPIDKLGRPIRDLRISLTDRCNFRCTYCMPKEVFGPDYVFLPKHKILSDDEFLRLIDAFSHLGLEKVRLTGGEPLLRPGIVALVERGARRQPSLDLSLTTNGARLKNAASDLEDAGLRRVNVSLDAISDDAFATMNGDRSKVQPVLDGVRAALDAKLEAKVNVVVKRGANEGEILPMARVFKEMGVPIRFIEYMDVGNTNQWKLDEVFTAKEILQTIESEFSIQAAEANYIGEVARRYEYTDGSGEIGIISSVTRPFCQDCHRARVSADGQLFTCLFASTGHDLKTLLRSEMSDADLTRSISDIWLHRKDRYSEERASTTIDARKVEMSFIGG